MAGAYHATRVDLFWSKLNSSSFILFRVVGGLVDGLVGGWMGGWMDERVGGWEGNNVCPFLLLGLNQVLPFY